jgi:hypothetical protein
MNQLHANVVAHRLLSVCKRGFVNEHAWMAWRKAHAKEIADLPLAQRNIVCGAWEQATAKEFS